MKELFEQDRAISPSTVRTATLLVGALFGVAVGLIILQALLSMFGADPTGGFWLFLIGLTQISLGAGLLLAIYMMVRLLGEGLMAQHRLHDRLTILTDELGSHRTAAQTPAAGPADTPAE